jgi:hypothetical protein
VSVRSHPPCFFQRRPVPGQVPWTRAPNPALHWALEAVLVPNTISRLPLVGESAVYRRGELMWRRLDSLKDPDGKGLKCVLLMGDYYIWHKQGPRRVRLCAAPLPHSHHALMATSCLCPTTERAQESPPNTKCLPLSN